MDINIKITTQNSGQLEPKTYEVRVKLPDRGDKKTLIRSLFDALILGINND